MKHNTRRYIQKKLFLLGEHIRYKYSHMGHGAKIVALSLTVCGITLFFPWLSIGDSTSIGTESVDKVYSFSSLVGYIGIFHLIGIIASLFFLFSYSKKEKIGYFLGFSVSQSRTISFLALLLFLLTIHTFLSIIGLKHFSADIFYERAIILNLAANIILLIGTYLLRKENKNIYKGTYLKEEGETSFHMKSQTQKKDNMKLPF